MVSRRDAGPCTGWSRDCFWCWASRAPPGPRSTACRSLAFIVVVAEIRAAEDSRRWDEVVWQGAPGEQSVWVIGPTTTRTQEVDQIALLGMPKTGDPCSGAATSRAPPASAGGSRRWSGRT